MNVKDKLKMNYAEFAENGPINIVAFGDSVTYGALADGEVDYETVYWNLLRKKILEKSDGIPINVINAGIGGITASGSLKRLDKQVLCHNPDLVIVCFGLNDVYEELNVYTSALEVIFKKCTESGADVIFMTPNMLNTYVAEDTEERLTECAGRTSEIQNSGKMDLYAEKAIEAAVKANVKVCDCYSMWKKLSETRDTTMLLANRINHPNREMHKLFAEMLFDVIFSDEIEESNRKDSNKIETMYGI